MVALKAEEKFMLLVDDFDRFNVKNTPAFDYHDGDDFSFYDDDDNPDGLWRS